MNKNIIIVIFGAVILCFAGFNNKFPLLTADTGVYINSGFNRTVPFHRTAMYGLFIAHSSWGRSIWLVVFSQALILSLILFYYFRYFSQNANYTVFYLAYLFFITFCMSASVTASTIDPGVFASITLLCTWLLLFAKNLTRRDFVIIAITTVISSGMAVSHLLTVMLITIIYGVRLLFAKRRQFLGIIETSLKRIIITGSLVFTTCLLVSVVHFSLGGGFNIINKKNLPKPPVLIKSELASLKSYKEIAGKTASKHGVLGDIKKKPVKNFLSQMVNIKIDKYDRMDERSETLQAIYRWFNSDLRECTIARQSLGWLTFNYLIYSQIISVVLSVLGIILFSIKKTGPNHRNLLVFIFLAILIQLFTNVIQYGKSNDMDYQIIWLLPLPVFLYLSEAISIKKTELNQLFIVRAS